jgi:hypothetical protein
MPNPTIRISEHAHRTLKELAQKTGEPMQSVVDRAVETYRIQTFLSEANASYERARGNPDGWKKLQQEVGEWEATLADGLPDESSSSRKRQARRSK